MVKEVTEDSEKSGIHFVTSRVITKKYIKIYNQVNPPPFPIC